MDETKRDLISNDLVNQVLTKCCCSADEAEMVKAIMLGKVTREFRGIERVGKITMVEFELTEAERIECLITMVRSQVSWNFCVANKMSLELKSLFCGSAPERYRIVKSAN